MYDLAADPGEAENLARDPGNRLLLQSMEQELLCAMRAVADDDERIFPGNGGVS